MKLGLAMGYSGSELRLPIDRVMLAERLGFDSVWAAEAYGSDAITPLAYLAARTERVRLGTSIVQLAGRTPAMAAMQAQTVDALAGGGRFIFGLGVSGPQIVEGWYGQPWGRPYWRLRDYVTIMQMIFAREEAVQYDGREFTLPYRGDGATGLGKPLKSILHTNPRLPIMLGAGGEATTKLSAELGQGILPLHFVPGSFEKIAPLLEEGFRRAGHGKGWEEFEIYASVRVTITDNLEEALASYKPRIALYVGGMGAREQNYHTSSMAAAGFPDEAAKIQELYLAGRKDEAIAAVPDEFAEREVLVGPPERIAQRYKLWAESGVTGLRVSTQQPEALELMAELAARTPAIGPVAALASIRPKAGTADRDSV